MRNAIKIAQKTILAAAVSSVLAPVSVYAQLEEVIVTAQKREQNLQDVPIAISAVTEEMLAQTGINTITQLIPMVPGLTGTDYGLATNSWAIRGISSNDDTIGSDPSVGVFFDDAYIGRNMFATGAFFDVNRIEVVKGPQGTLFGRNASAGAISLISNKPGDENELRLGVALGDEGQERYEVVGNLALSDSFALRLAYQGEKWEGMWEEVNSGDDAYTESDTIRLMARWDVTDDFEALFRANYSKAETNYTSAVNIPLNLAEPGEEYPDKYALSNPNYEEVKDDGFGMRLTWDINDSLTLVSITDVRSGDVDYRSDADNTAADAVIDAILGPVFGASTVFFGTEDDADTVYQEFRLSGGSDSLSWFAGVSYYNEELDSPNWNTELIDTAFDLGAVAATYVSNKADNTSYGAYADATWMVTDKLALIGGLRYTYDDKDWCSNTSADDIGLGGGPTDGELCSNETWDEWTPRLVAQYDIGDEVMVFGSVAKGYKGGGFNVAAVDTNDDFLGDTIAPFDPETSIAYELGLKSTLLDNRVQLNGSVFYTDYDDLQMQSLTLEFGQVISNAATAETKGLEMEVSYSPLENLVLMANYAYIDAEITEGELDGAQLAFAPENTFAAGVNFNHNFLAGDLNWFAQYTWTDDFYYEASNDLQEDAYGLLNGKVTYTAASERWDLAIAADNITDEDYAAARWDFGWGETLHWGYKRMVRAEFNIYF
jgi:iron complex outermembrane receptor protein